LASAERTIEDRLREEYFDLLPDIRRVAEQLDAEIRCHLLQVSKGLDRHERLVIRSRIKDYESALQKLRGDREGATFLRDRPELYSLTSLNDLAGVRVLAFPRSRLNEIDLILRNAYGWGPDPFKEESAGLGFKYCGYHDASATVKAEYQIVSVLTGLFWDVEHSVMYKPHQRLGFVSEHLGMNQRTSEVFQALQAFEEEFEAALRKSQGTQ
jgi:ppGpp synthetase/RelA/SpoT-type nucleotidyltranferase